MSQIKNKSKEFVDTNQIDHNTVQSNEFGYWKSLKDISSSDDYDKI